MNRFSEAFPRPGTLKQDLRWLIMAGAVCYALNLALRLSLWTLWDDSLFRVGDEFIMATHDAYLWLAHARVSEFGDGRALAYFTRLLHEFTGLGLGTIGFWAPAFLASLVSVVCLLWGWLLGGRNAALFAGLVGALTPGFYARTRLGYYDTDMFTLLMPLAVAFLLAMWAKSHTREKWIGRGEQDSKNDGAVLLALGAGLFARFAGWWHDDIARFCLLLFLLVVVYVLVLGRKGRRGRACLEAAVFAMAAFPGLQGVRGWPVSYFGGAYSESLVFLAGAVILTAAVLKVKALHRPNTFIGVVVLVLAIFAGGAASNTFGAAFGKFLTYMKPATDAGIEAKGYTPPFIRRLCRVSLKPEMCRWAKCSSERAVLCGSASWAL